ncbi:N-acetylglucosamine kinase [Filifactor villosus]|uniref:N-acetylglucosamine kinase n=1 Tax=Filifactor villosus TaxID=29374 RepID=A0ABV9QJ11_9FIRM
MRFLGIDGGGTKTAFLLADEHGCVLASAERGTIHIRQVDIAEFEARIRSGLEELSRQTGEEVRPDNSFIAIPGYGEFQEEISGFEAVLKRIFGSCPFQMGNDSVAGWAAMGTRPGVNLVMGTGSIAYGRDAKGNEARTGGWGPFCGDEGSAYWLGKKTIEIFSKQSDGRLPAGELHRIVREELKLGNDFDIIDYVTLELGGDRTAIAALSILLYRAAEAGDEDAIASYAQAAKEGAAAVRAVVRKLEFCEGESVYVGCSGGVFRAGRWVTEPLREYLSDLSGIRFRDARMSPAKGAALMACRQHGIEITREVLEEWER